MPNPSDTSPTQEVERFEVELSSGDSPVATMEPCRDGEYVRFDDYEDLRDDLLRSDLAREAEVEKREEVEGEREEWKGRTEPDISPGDVIAAEPDGTIYLDDGITTWNPARACAFLTAQAEQAAESRISTAVEELEKQKDAAETLHDYAIKCDDDLTRAYQTGGIAAAETALQLLRDEGEKACEHGNTFDCPECRLDVLELMDDEGDEQGGADA